MDHWLNVDRLGRLLEFDGIVRTLDPQGNLSTEQFPSGPLVKNRYERGKKTEFDLPLFDLQIQYQQGPLDLEKVSFKNHSHAYTAYDLAGNLLEEVLLGPLGILSHTYDPAQRPLSLTSPQFTQRIEEYDPLGNIRRMNVNGEQQAYTYDDLYQLTSETGSFSHQYTFDTLYNRLSKDGEQYTLNPLNETISHCEYDPNGNPTRLNSFHLSYDALDRLIRVETFTTVQTFTYDYLNRCLSRTTEGSSPLFFLYDGQNEIGSFNDEGLQDFRVLGRTPTAEIGAAVAILLQNDLYAPIHDLQGNLTTLLPIDQSSPCHYRYSAFGEEDLGWCATSPWRFSSKRTDPLTGFVNYGRRYYVPTFGFWLTPDPLGLTAGSNLYAFLHNAPLTHLDEYGLYSMPISSLPSQIDPESNKRLCIAAIHEVGDQALGMGQFVASSPYHAERGFNYLTGRQNYTFAKWNEQQSQFFNKAADWMYRAIPTDTTHPDYLMYRRGIEIGSFFAGGYALFKGGIKAAQWGTQISRWGIQAWKRKGTFVAGEKLARSTTNIPLGRFDQAARQLSETGQNNIRVLRGWAKSKGWKKQPNFQGAPEKWGVYQNDKFEWRLVIKPEASTRSGLQTGSNIPRFDARLLTDTAGQSYINPFTGEVGNWQVGTHLPLEFNP